MPFVIVLVLIVMVVWGLNSWSRSIGGLTKFLKSDGAQSHLKRVQELGRKPIGRK